MSKGRPAIRQLWYAALHEPLGILVRTPDPYNLKHMLYSERTLARDPILQTLMIKSSPADPTHEVWIIKVEQ